MSPHHVHISQSPMLVQFPYRFYFLIALLHQVDLALKVHQSITVLPLLYLFTCVTVTLSLYPGVHMSLCPYIYPYIYLDVPKYPLVGPLFPTMSPYLPPHMPPYFLFTSSSHSPHSSIKRSFAGRRGPSSVRASQFSPVIKSITPPSLTPIRQTPPIIFVNTPLSSTSSSPPSSPIHRWPIWRAS